MIKVLIADDHTIFNDGPRQFVDETNNAKVIEETENGHEILEQIRKGDFDVIVLDISMPGMSGMDALKQFKAARSKQPVLILSTHSEEQYAVRCLKAGASGYLSKQSAAEELLSAIRKISSGSRYVTASLAERLATNLDRTAKRSLHEALSDREYQVMCMIASGNTPTEIAEKLSLSVKTISTYRTRALRKMKMKTNAQLTYYAIKRGLVE